MAQEFMAQRGFQFTYDDLDADGQRRAQRIMSPDIGWSPSKGDDSVPQLPTAEVDEELSPHRGPTTFQREFHAFCCSFPQGSAWRNLSPAVSRVFFDESAMEEYLVIRCQKAGTCYLHAGALWQHYLQCLRTTTGRRDHNQLDLSTYIRDCMSDEDVAKILEKGRIRHFFSRITGIPMSNLQTFWFTARNSQFPTHFNFCTQQSWEAFSRRREPALVSNFKIERAFVEGTRSVFDYEVDEAEFYKYAHSKNRSEPVKQSMVLIGAHREEETGKVWFLLQKFWRNQYFCLVSAEYLASCCATIHFVCRDDEDVSLKGRHATVDAWYVETDLEVEECEELEEHELEGGDWWHEEYW